VLWSIICHSLKSRLSLLLWFVMFVWSSQWRCMLNWTWCLQLISEETSVTWEFYMTFFLGLQQDMTLACGDNFVNSHLECTFNKFAQAFYRQYHKVQRNIEQVYMNLRMIKQNLNEKVEEHCKWIITLENSFQHSTDDWLLNAFFRVGLLPYLWMVTTNMERSTWI
jgi:ABC-type multidrug transport system fused ATPase/permease subunit